MCWLYILTKMQIQKQFVNYNHNHQSTSNLFAFQLILILQIMKNGTCINTAQLQKLSNIHSSDFKLGATAHQFYQDHTQQRRLSNNPYTNQNNTTLLLTQKLFSKTGDTKLSLTYKMGTKNEDSKYIDEKQNKKVSSRKKNGSTKYLEKKVLDNLLSNKKKIQTVVYETLLEQNRQKQISERCFQSFGANKQFQQNENIKLKKMQTQPSEFYDNSDTDVHNRTSATKQQKSRVTHFFLNLQPSDNRRESKSPLKNYVDEIKDLMNEVSSSINNIKIQKSRNIKQKINVIKLGFIDLLTEIQNSQETHMKKSTSTSLLHSKLIKKRNVYDNHRNINIEVVKIPKQQAKSSSFIQATTQQQNRTSTLKKFK